MNKLIYHFGDSHADGDSSMKDMLGSKGANLAQMCKMGLPIPAGFTISSDLCKRYLQDPDSVFTKEFEGELLNSVNRLEKETGKIFGDKK